MYNSFGERRVQFVRVAIPTLERTRRQGYQQPEATVSAGVPADAALVGVVFAETGNAPDAREVLLVYERPDWPLVVAGGMMPELVITETVATAATVQATETVQEG
jgi:hypothetical protein